jgi:cysteine desulfurase / selenocysteine lyase
MYVRKEAQEHLRPTTQGWHNVRNPNFVAQEQIEYKPDARRYEAGSHNLLGLVGLRASLELLTEIGVENIARDLVQKRRWFVPELKSRGYTILNEKPALENTSGIIAFTKSDADIPALHARLAENNITTSIRADRQNRSFIRLSPHFYNTDAELRRVLEFL